MQSTCVYLFPAHAPDARAAGLLSDLEHHQHMQCRLRTYTSAHACSPADTSYEVQSATRSMPALMLALKICLGSPSTRVLAQRLYTRRHAQNIQAQALEAAYADVIKDATQLHRCSPVVYSALYNISFFGLEKLHPFDAAKFAKVAAALKKQKLLPEVCLLASLLSVRFALTATTQHDASWQV